MNEFVLVWLVALTGTDLAHRRLPNRLTVPPLLASLASACADADVAAAIVVAGVPYLAAVVIGGCGGGDLKFAVALGRVIADPVRVAVVVVAAAVLTCAAAAGPGRSRPPAVGVRRGVAHGPALVAAALVFGGVVP